MDNDNNHGLATQSFVSDYLNTLTENEQDTNSKTTNFQHTKETNRYLAHQATDAHFHSDWIPSKLSAYLDRGLIHLHADEISHVSFLINTAIYSALNANHPLRPSQIRATLNRFYYLKQFHVTEMICRAWINYVLTTSTGRGSYRDIAETGIRCAVHLLNVELVGYHYNALASSSIAHDGNSSFVLATVASHFLNYIPTMLPTAPTLLTHFRTSLTFRPNDVDVWTHLTRLLANKSYIPIHLQPIMHAVAYVAWTRALSIMYATQLPTDIALAQHRWLTRWRMLLDTTNFFDPHTYSLPATYKLSDDLPIVHVPQRSNAMHAELYRVTAPNHTSLMHTAQTDSICSNVHAKIPPTPIDWPKDWSDPTPLSPGPNAQTSEYSAVSVLAYIYVLGLQGISKKIEPSLWALNQINSSAQKNIPDQTRAQHDADDMDHELDTRNM